MDTTDLDKIEVRLNAATPGPWRWTSVDGWDGVCEEAHPAVPVCVLRLNHPPNAGLIAHAPEDLRALVAEVRRLTGERDAWRTYCEGARESVATLTAERDEARKMLAECYVLSGADADGNTVESGWVHLWNGAVAEVRELRANYDDALLG